MIHRNASARHVLRDVPVDRAPMALHRTLPGYAPTPLHDAADLAAEVGVGRLWLKDESSRLGLPAFKIIGASWAVAYALKTRLDLRWSPDEGLPALAHALHAREGARPWVVAATDGNHGRAVARMARLLDLRSRIFVPEDMVDARRDAIVSEGAELVVVPGSYDDAVAASAAEEGPDHIVVSDTSWPGYTDIPAQVIAGYSTVLWEVDDELERRDAATPTAVLVPVGVGAFAAAVTAHYRRPEVRSAPAIVSVEPTTAACALASAHAGRLTSVPGPHTSIMAGLNCGRPSEIAWPLLSKGVDLFVAIDDDVARQGMRDLARIGVVGGECAGGALGAVPTAIEALGLDRDAEVLVFLTEGATDPAGYLSIVGRTPEDIAGHDIGQAV